MYKSKIFLVGEGKDNLLALEETGFLTENVLQELLADYPDLLPGDQIDPEAPRRWLLVTREMGIPGDVAESERWSLDHLFLDQDGVPTFVECKRAVDTRARREVVAQMLDYAANGVEYWSMDRLRQAATETAERRDKSLDDEIARLLDEAESDIETYWTAVEKNLHDRRVRLIFVADSTPRELRRLVEFLNEEMEHVEVLAVEVKQFQRDKGTGQKALVSRVVGLTESTRGAKGSQGRQTEQQFLKQCAPAARQFFERVLSLSKDRGHVINWGTVSFSIRARSAKEDRLASFVYGFHEKSTFQFYFAELHRLFGIANDTASALRSKLLEDGVFKESGRWTLTAHVSEANRDRMNDLYDFILAQIDDLVKG